MSDFPDVDVALLIGLGHTQTGHVQAPAVVQIEVVRNAVERLGVDRRAHADGAHRHAAEGAGLHPQRDPVGDPLLVGYGRDAVGQADPQVYQRVFPQLHGGPAADDLAHVEFHGRASA